MNVNPDKNHRILVIDDNHAIHEDLRKILIKPATRNDELTQAENALFGDGPESETPKLPDFQIDSAYQGQQGLDLIEKSLEENYPYAMAFVDVRMPHGW